MQDQLSLKAYAKINLALDVLGTLPNGYHEVRMIMQSISVHDKVNLYRDSSGKLTVTTNLSFLPTGPENLVYQAAKLLMDEFHITDGVHIDLYKFIPVAAGLAGGSSDAAAVFRGMNQMFDLGLSLSELQKRAVKLGADIPYCLLGGTALSEGIGEQLTILSDLPECHLVISKPNISVSTKYVYDHLILDENTVHPDVDGMIEAIQKQELKGVCDRLGNVLETVTRTEYPIIRAIEQEMKACGACNTIMSGSGPTVFGIFTDKDQAYACSERLRSNREIQCSYYATPVSREVVQC